MAPMRTPNRCGLPAARRVRRGVATLVVVMVLFFIVALVAAYTSRNLIFEQRTSANQYRGTQAFEAAEAGLEWALTMLNSGRIDTACQPHADPATEDGSFRDRYLRIDAASGAVSARVRSNGQALRPACVFDGSSWQCSCPVDAAPTLTQPAGAGPAPAFVLRFSGNTPAYPSGSGAYPPGVIRIESTGCTRLDTAAGCASSTASGDGRATVTVLAALKSAVTTAPAAAITVRGELRLLDGDLRAIASPGSNNGVSVHTGTYSNLDHRAYLEGPPGTPGDLTVVNGDALLNGLLPRHMFASVFAMDRDTYRLQPAAVWVDCAVDCSASVVRDKALLNPGRMLWIKGDFDFSIADPIGSSDRPVTMVIDGDVTVSNADAKLTGVVYAVGENWSGAGKLTLRGALIAESDLELSNMGGNIIQHDPSVLQLLNKSSGSFVRVPGSWRDF